MSVRAATLVDGAGVLAVTADASRDGKEESAVPMTSSMSILHCKKCLEDQQDKVIIQMSVKACVRVACERTRASEA